MSEEYPEEEILQEGQEEQLEQEPDLEEQPEFDSESVYTEPELETEESFMNENALTKVDTIYSESTNLKLEALQNEITEQEARQIEQSSISTGNRIDAYEIYTFKRLLWLNSSVDFVKKVKEIQKLNWFNEDEQDWIINVKTLKVIYKTIYEQNPEIMSIPLIKGKYIELFWNTFKKEDVSKNKILVDEKNWEIVDETEKPVVELQSWEIEKTDETFINPEQRRKEIEEQIRQWKAWIHFDIITWKNYFANVIARKWKIIFDNSPSINEKDKSNFISKDLAWVEFNDKIDESKNQIFVSKIDKVWKTVLRFYIKWQLHLSTIVSPWLPKKPTDQDFYSWKHSRDIDHISSEYPKTKESKWWAVMPYAVALANWIWIHWSADKIDWNYHSHWCIRTPTYYAKEIFEKVNELQEHWEKVIIDTRWIY